jgi:SAM-dependent methyltransferase
MMTTDRRNVRVGLRDEIARFWDEDAITYDLAREHRAASATERAAWNASMKRFVSSGMRVLDIGAGTGFLTLIAARLGAEVCAFDISGQMLGQLANQAREAKLFVKIIRGIAEDPPSGPFDVVISRHLLWTLPDPEECLRIWKAKTVAPEGQLVLFEGLWGSASRREAVREHLQKIIRNVRREPPSHHAEYGPEITRSLPFADGIHPDRLVEVIESAGWQKVCIERLHDVEWARLIGLSPLDRLIGVIPQYVVSASA